MNEWVLVYPDTDEMPLASALDGDWHPEIISVNENLLADDLSLAIGDEIDLLDVRDKYDLIYDVDKTPFRFIVDLSFDVIDVKGWYMIEITDVAIYSSWGKDREGFSIELPVKWSEESLIATLENQVRILI